MSKSAFRVIIVGGGVAGLCLAKMLEKFDLDYVLLEAYDSIDCPSGAGIGLMPNGCFLLDQMGCYDAVKTAADDGDIEESYIRSSDGKPIITLKHMMYHQEKRHGYSMLFFDRQSFLRVMYDELEHKNRIHTNSRVAEIKLMDGVAQVMTKDGKCWTGDIVVGADGIHSMVRREMRRLADTASPGYFEPGEEDTVPCHYKCSYGIAQGVDGWSGGEQGFTTGNCSSFLVVSGPGGRVYWFLFVRLPQVMYGDNIPKFSKEDEARFVKENQGLKIKEDLTFAQIYAKRVSSVLTPLHEIVYKKWFFDRILLIGDSAHKPNPIGGMGANAAIETAAEFLNAILDLRRSRQQGLNDLSSDEVTSVFKRVQDSRFARAHGTISSSHELQSLNAYEDPMLSSLVWRVLTPLAGKHNFFRELSNRIVGASRLAHLEVPSRPHALPYDHELPAKPVGVRSRRTVWGCFSLTMVALIYTANRAMKVEHDELGSWGTLAPLRRNWVDASIPNDILNVLTSLLSFPVLDSGLAARVQLIYFLTHMVSPLIIYTIEGYRVGRTGTVLSLPIIFMVGMQVQGICKFAPLYALVSALHSGQTPVDRALPIQTAKSLIPALVLGFIIPTILMIAPTTDASRWQDWTALFQVSPPLFSVLTAVLSYSLSTWWRLKGQGASRDEKHSEWYSTDDVPILRSAYDFAFATQATVHLATLAYIYSHPGLSVAAVFGNLPNPFDQQWNLSLADRVLAILRYDLVLTHVAIACHNLYSVWELRSQGYISTLTAMKSGALVFLGQGAVGSGATWAGLWRWREDVLTGLSVTSS